MQFSFSNALEPDTSNCQRENYFRECYLIQLMHKPNVRYQRYSTLLTLFFLPFIKVHVAVAGSGNTLRQLKEQLQAQALPPCTRSGQV